MSSRVVKRGVFEEYEDQENELKLFFRNTTDHRGNGKKPG